MRMLLYKHPGHDLFFLVILSSVLLIFDLPFDYYDTFVIEEKYRVLFCGSLEETVLNEKISFEEMDC